MDVHRHMLEPKLGLGLLKAVAAWGIGVPPHSHLRKRVPVRPIARGSRIPPGKRQALHGASCAGPNSSSPSRVCSEAISSPWSVSQISLRSVDRLSFI